MKCEKRTLITSYRIITILTPMYGSECWKLTKKANKKNCDSRNTILQSSRMRDEKI